MSQRIEVRAPAKINLTLHVTGQRDDGYHLLDSLVAFATVHDTLTVAVPAQGLSLTVDGPEAACVPTDGTNLALRAAGLVMPQGAAIHLEKTLPSAAGIGGGSADAAAVLRAGLWQCVQPEPDPAEWDPLARLGDMAALERLGADVPMCLTSETQRVTGIGSTSVPVTLPCVPAILANPRRAVSTPSVFKALRTKTNPPMPDDLPPLEDPEALIAFLAEMRNDLQQAACAVEPGIAEVLDTLAALPGARLARMSGSGATCFAIFDGRAKVEAAVMALQRSHPDWWIAECEIGSCAKLARPRIAEPVS